MADATVHIHIDTPVNMAKLDALLSAAIDAKDIEVQSIVPNGYRCALCFRADGGHESNCTVNIPAGVNSGSTVPCDKGALDEHVKAHPKTNWVDKVGGLPDYIRDIACHVHFDHGLPVPEAIAIAVADAKRMCATGESNFGHIHTAPQARACADVAEWERKRAQAHASHLVPKVK